MANPHFRIADKGITLPDTLNNHHGEFADGLRAFEMAARHCRWLQSETGVPCVVWCLRTATIVYEGRELIASAYQAWLRRSTSRGSTMDS